MGPQAATGTAKPRIVALLGGLAAMSALSTNILLPAFPEIARDLAVPHRQIGLILSSFLLAFALGQLVVGPLSDRIGRTRPILWGLALFAAGSVVVAAAPGLPLMLAGRVLQALGVCSAAVLSRAIARDLFDGPDLARVLSLTMVAMAAAPGFSPLIGGLLVETAGWRVMVLLVAAAGLLLALAYRLRLGETLPPARRRVVGPGAIAASYRMLARDPDFIRPASAVALIIGGLYAVFGATPEILMGIHGRTRLELGLFFAATVFVVFGAGLAAPRLALRFGAPNVARAGALVAVTGGVVLAMAPGLLGFTAGVVAFLSGMGLVNPLGTARALQPFARKAGLASALLGFLQMAAAAASTAAISLLPGSAQVTLGLGLAALSAGSLAFLLGPKRSVAACD